MLVLVEAQQISDGIGSVRTLVPAWCRTSWRCSCWSSPLCSPSTSLRGGRGEQESGEDVDLSHGTEWRTLLGLAALVAGSGQLIPSSASRPPGRCCSSAPPDCSARDASSSTSW